MDPIDTVFKPESIALVGASPKEGKLGHVILNNLIHGSKENIEKGEAGGFKGKIYPIHPKAEEILGLKAYGAVSQVPDPVDLAVVVVPPQAVKDVIEDCGKKGTRSVVIITAGFSETGEEGARLEHEMLEAAKEHGVRIVGPNCLGIMNPYLDLNATFGDAIPARGPISFVSQSGALCTSIINYSFEEYLGFSNFVSIGDKADIDDADLIDYFHRDPNTKCIMLYIESLKDARKFYEAARRIVKDKPVVAFKSGYTAEGAKATSSHTGSIAGSDTAYDAAFRQAGVFRARTLSQLFDASRALAYQPIPNGENVAIITNAGGPGVLAVDTAYDLGLKPAVLKDETVARLDAVCPSNWSKRNPVDIIGDADAKRYGKSLEIVMEADEVDAVILLMAPTATADPVEVAKNIVETQKKVGKPVTVSFVGMVAQDGENYLDSHGIPEIEYPERAVFAMYALMERRRFLEREGIL